MSWEIIHKSKGRIPAQGVGIKFLDKSPSCIGSGLTSMLDHDLEFIEFFIGMGDDAGMLAFQQVKKETILSFKLAYYGVKKNRCSISCRGISIKLKLNKVFVEFEKTQSGRFIGVLPKDEKTVDVKEQISKPRTVQIIKPKPEKEEVIVKKEPAKQEEVIVKKDDNKDRHIIKFRKVNECRLSKSLSDFSKMHAYIKVEKVPGQDEMRISFSNTPGSDKFNLKRYSNGTHFAAAGFIKLYDLEGKVVEFEYDERSHFFQGNIF